MSTTFSSGGSLLLDRAAERLPRPSSSQTGSFAANPAHQCVRLPTKRMAAIEAMMPLQQKALRDADAADVIRIAIMEGELKPGTHLVESDLARSLRVSRGTVRAALHRLRNEGLVRYEPTRGSFVMSLEPQDAWEVYTLRNALEGLAARLAASTITESSRTAVMTIWQRIEAAARSGDRRQLTKLDSELHELIVNISGHRRLAELYRSIGTQSRLYFILSDPIHTELSEIIALHEPLVRAILDGNAELAEQLASSHNTVDGEILVRQLREASIHPRSR